MSSGREDFGERQSDGEKKKRLMAKTLQTDGEKPISSQDFINQKEKFLLQTGGRKSLT